MKLIFCLITLLTTSSLATAHYITCDEPFDRYHVNSQCTISHLNADYTSKFNVSGFDYIYYDGSNTRTNYKHQIKKVQFTDSILQNFPVELFATLSNLSEFSARDCGITEVCRHYFQNGGELIHLDLSGNLIEKLPHVAFLGAEKLQELDLSLNRIAEIQASALHELPHLSILKLSYNRISTVTKEMFNDFYYLDKIYLDHNQIEVLGGDAFSGCPNLRYLWLNDNQLRVLADLDKVGTMRYVDLKSNQLETLDWQKTRTRTLDVTNNSLTWIRVSRGMEYLYAASNQIARVELTSTDLNVWEMNLSKNNLSTLENVTNIASMGILDVSFNNIGALNMSSFAAVPLLQTLNLEATKLSNIQYGTFSHLTKMKTIDISFNNLTTLDLHMLAAMSELENFYVDGNNLTVLDHEHLHTYFANLTFIGISNNRFNCTYLSRLLKGLKTLKVSVYIEPSSLVTTTSNVMGVGCWSDDHSGKFRRIEAMPRHFALTNTDAEELAANETAYTRHLKLIKAKDDAVLAQSNGGSVLLVMNLILMAVIVGFGVMKAVQYMKRRNMGDTISFNTRSNSVLTIEQNI